MDQLVTELRAVAEPTRLRLLALCARGGFRVSDLCELLGQSQPRLSRHLKILTDAGLLQRVPEGAHAYFQLAPDAELARLLVARLPESDPLLAADRRGAVRLAAERARAASLAFQRHGADWDEARALGLDAQAIGTAVLAALPPRLGRLLDIGTGTGGLLELVAPRVDSALGIDASREMLALARSRLAERGLGDRCSVRQADFYRLPLPDRAYDAVTLVMVLHYADEPAAALAEAARVLRPDGLLLVVDLAPHGGRGLPAAYAHQWPGFDDAALAGWLGAAGCALADPATLPGPLPVRIWPARRLAAAQLGTSLTVS